MPRPRKTASNLMLAGSFRTNPSRTRADVKGHGAIGSWKPGSADPKAIWAELVAAAPEGILSASDRPALEQVTRTISAVRASDKALSITQLSTLIGVLGKLGLTPAGRHALDAPAAAPISEKQKREDNKRFSEFKLAGRDD